MRRMIAIACALAMISGATHAQASAAQATAPKPHAPMTKKKKASAKSPSPVEAVAPAPPPQPVPVRVVPPVPATLMNSAPVNPNVTMKGGLLTIDAPNCTLGEVLTGVRMATGAKVEGPWTNERVAVRLGPGAPRQVIAALLRGTPYDYLILGSLENPDAVTRIVLTQTSAGASAQDSPGQRPQPVIQETPVNDFADSPPTEDVAAQPAGEIQTDQTQPQAQPEPQPQPDQNPPKTPEQLFKELMPAQTPPAAQPAQ